MSTETPAQSRWAIWRAITVIIVVLAMMVWGAIYGARAVYDKFGGKDVQRQDLGNGVVVSSDELPKGLYVHVAADPAKALPADLQQFTLRDGKPWAQRISHVYDFGPGQKFDEPIKAEIPVDHLPAKGHPLIALTGETGAQKLETAKIVGQGVRKNGQAYVVVEMRHFSILEIIEGVTEWIGDKVVKTFEWLGGDVVKDAEQPTCAHEVSSKEYLVIPNGTPDVLLYCLGRDASTGKLTLLTANNRRYALKLKPSGMEPVSYGDLKFDLVEIQKLLKTGPIIRPREEAALTVKDLKPGEQATLDTGLDGTALFLTTVWSVAQIVADAIGLDPDLETIKDIVVVMLSLPNCANAGIDGLDSAGGWIQLFKNCVNESWANAFAGREAMKAKDAAKKAQKEAAEKAGKAAKKFNAGKVLSVVFGAMEVSQLVRSWANVVGDLTNNRAKQTLVVKRLSLLPRLKGEWRESGYLQLRMKADGTGTQTLTFGDTTEEDGICYTALVNGGNYCRYSGSIKLTKVNDDGSVSGVYGKPRFDLNGKSIEPPASLLQYVPEEGEAVTVKIDQSANLIKVTNSRFNNLKFCGSGHYYSTICGDRD